MNPVKDQYFEQTDAAVYNADLIWLRDTVVPNMAMGQLCEMAAEKVVENKLNQMDCSPQFLLMLKTMLGQ